MDVNSISPSAKRTGSPLPESKLQKRAKNDETTKSDSKVGDLATSESMIDKYFQATLAKITKEKQWVDKEIKEKYPHLETIKDHNELKRKLKNFL